MASWDPLRFVMAGGEKEGRLALCVSSQTTPPAKSEIREKIRIYMVREIPYGPGSGVLV